MARFSDDTISRIKSDVSLIRLVESQGYHVVKQGKDYAVNCPFHEDKTPSCIITPKSNLFNCFGCGVGGSVIDWVMKTQGVSFRHAVEILRDQHLPLAAIAATPGDTPKSKTTVPVLDSPIDQDADAQTLLQQVIEYYHKTLLQSPEALAYLEKRGLNDPELITQFKLGYANRTLGLRLPQKNRQAGAQMREQLKQVGLYRETGREHFNGSLVIPVINAGQILEVYGRKLLDTLRKGTPKHTYLSGPHAGVFNREALVASDEIILCESLIDALTFWRLGFRHVTTSYGVNGFTDELLQALIEHKIKRVLIAYDRDDAGNKAADDVAKQLNKNNIDAYRLLFPKGMDANSFACQTQPGEKALALVIRKAEFIGAGQKNTCSSKSKTRESKILPDTPSLVAEIAESDVDTHAMAQPPMSTHDVQLQQSEHEVLITFGERSYRVRGFESTNVDQLKIQLLIRSGELFHSDKLDLYSSKQRQVFINQASVELGVKDEIIKKDLGRLLLQLETLQQQSDNEDIATKEKDLSDPERKAALELLQDPSLLSRILQDFITAGVVGEDTNKLVGYLACVSRKLDKPLAVIIQSTSAAGKSSLMDAILNLMPESERTQYSAMTGQSLFYMGETNLKHKILAIAEEEGASNASYALKLLQSEGQVTIASTGKDDSTGNLVTKEYKVEGPVMLFLTTTAIDIDEELLNRCLVLTVNESREQTQAIHAAQRAKRTLQGLHNSLQKKAIVALHRNAQHLLQSLHVINPFADQLSFRSDLTRTRRDHEKYLTLIDSIALLHQYQRTIKTVEHDDQLIEYIEVQLSDIETANYLAHETLGRTLDELPPQTRKLLKQIQDFVQIQCQKEKIEQSHYRFSRKHIRAFTGWSDGQLKIHCKRMEDMEYLLVHRGGRGQSLEYELPYTGNSNDDGLQLMGLIDPATIKKCSEKYTYDAQKSGQSEQKSGPSQAQVSPKLELKESLNSTAHGTCSESRQGKSENALQVV